MAGKAGQKGAKATAIPLRYASGFMAELDGRSAVARELRGRLDDLMADLGGVEVLSYQRRSLCERAIHLEARLQSLEAAFAQGTAENGDESRYAALTNYLLQLTVAIKSRKGASRINKFSSFNHYYSCQFCRYNIH